MRTKDFYFDLPEHLIAQEPSASRGEDRLLVLDKLTGAVIDQQFKNFASLIPSNAVLVFNDSKVRKARVYATKDSTGNECEFLLIKPIFGSDKLVASNQVAQTGTLWKVMVRNAKRHRPGHRYTFADGTRATIIQDHQGILEGGEFRLLCFETPIDDTWLDVHGHVPLPPYISRADTTEDASRYQTVYAHTVGSVAAPTAGLHFTPEVLASLTERGIETHRVTLHVGLGTFLPVRSEKIEDHHMHTESYYISEETAAAITRAKKEGRPIIAIGTTSIRTLESAWDAVEQRLRAGEGETNIFIYPGYTFKVVDQVFTNFHTPESTLLMLVSAFAGKDTILKAYAHAIAHEYRFFSYGDAMYIR